MLLVLGAPFLFGYAKPVPVAVERLHNPRVAMMLVAAAGPAINIILACGSALLINILPAVPGAAQPWLASVLEKSILINLVLATFNMLPIPPLDGGRIAVGLLPPKLAAPLANMERYGFFVVLGLLFLLPMLGREIGMDLNFIWHAIEFVVGTLLVAILTVFT
jgi:Zn-dependent protease